MSTTISSVHGAILHILATKDRGTSIIKTAYAGFGTEVAQRIDITYPLLFVDMEFNLSGQNGGGTVQIGLEILTQAIEGDSLGYSAAVEQCEYEATRIVSLLHKDDLLAASPQYSMFGLFRAYPDLLCGVRLDLTISIDKPLHVCEL